MKVYAVWAWNGWDYEDSCTWVMDIFASRKSAEEYIQNIRVIYAEESTRINTLHVLRNNRGLTKAEEKEDRELAERWYSWDEERSECWIKEYKVRE